MTSRMVAAESPRTPSKSPSNPSRVVVTVQSPTDDSEADAAQGPHFRRESSYMQDVRDRISMLQDGGTVPDFPLAPSRKSLKGNAHASFHQLQRQGSLRSTLRAARVAALPRRSAITDQVCGSTKRLNLPPISFCKAIVIAIVVSVSLACGALFALTGIYATLFKNIELVGCQKSVNLRRGLVSDIVYNNVATQQFEVRLKSLVSTLDRSVTGQANSALDAVWGHMITENHQNKSWTGFSEEGRDEISYSSWVALSRLWRGDSKGGNTVQSGTKSNEQVCETRFAGIFVSSLSGQLAGFSVTAGQGIRDGGCTPKEGMYWNGDGETSGNSDSVITQWIANPASGKRTGESRTKPWNPRNNTAMQVQEKIATESGSDRLTRRAWSKLHALHNTDGYGISWTGPISYCGRYDCLIGAISASVHLHAVSDYCHRLLLELVKDLTSQPIPVPISEDTSSLFIVNQVAYAAPEQQGILVAASGETAFEPQDKFYNATDAPQRIVRLTARMILKRFGTWDSADLLGGQSESNRTIDEKTTRMIIFTFNQTTAEQGEYQNCTSELVNHPECSRVGLMSTRMDNRSRWLAVLVLPTETFAAKAIEVRARVDDLIDDLDGGLTGVVTETEAIGLTVLVVASLISIFIGACIGTSVSLPLRRLGVLMRRLGDLDFAHESAEFAELAPGKRSRIRDVRELQEAFRRLSRGTEAFARFVPETVVRNILHGDRMATKLHVSRRRISIMNSDIEGFTAISEKLSKPDLLFVLTRYLSVMTRVIELYEGVVSEIQGDGLIVFWNTPDNVDDHASKACAAALAQQHAVGWLNTEFSKLGLPTVNVRIGIHTGEVMSGNIGSETKMKFGCLGEPLKIAGDLQEYCKPYGAKIIIGADTHSDLEESYGFLCRRLDKLQLKGGEDKTWIYEVVGRESVESEGDGEHVEVSVDEPTQDDEETAGVRMTTSTRRPGSNTSLKSTSSVVSEAIRRSTSSLASPSAPIWRPIQKWLWTKRSVSTIREELESRSKAAEMTPDKRQNDDDSIGACDQACPPGRSGTDSLTAAGSSPDVVTSDQRRRAQMYEETLDALHSQRFDQAASLAEVLVSDGDDEAAMCLAERVRSACGLIAS